MKKNLLLLSLLVTATIGSRLLPHPANFSPIASLLLITPLLLQDKNKLLGFAPILGLLISDVFLGIHSTMLYVYGSYVLIALLGLARKNIQRSYSFFSLPLIASFLFFTITNFGVWATTSMYTDNLNGLLTSYWMGIPFFRMTLVGDVFFFTLLYGGFLLTRNKMESDRKAHSFA